MRSLFGLKDSSFASSPQRSSGGGGGVFGSLFGTSAFSRSKPPPHKVTGKPVLHLHGRGSEKRLSDLPALPETTAPTGEEDDGEDLNVRPSDPVEDEAEDDLRLSGPWKLEDYVEGQGDQDAQRVAALEAELTRARTEIAELKATRSPERP